MPFELRDHTADVAVAASGDALGDAFAAAADGMAAAMCEEVPPAGGERFAVEERARSRESLLYDYLDRLIYERDVRGVLPVDNRATVRREGGEWIVAASARGVPLDAVSARDLKAVTYSQMAVEETADGWDVYVVFDV